MKEKYAACLLVLSLIMPALVSVPALGDINSYITVKKYWEESGNYTITSGPDGLLSDGESMNTVAENGNYGNNYAEAIYLDTDKGVVAIDPSGGNELKEQPSSVLPADAGKIVRGPLIHSMLRNGSSTLIFTTEGGKLAALGARIDSWPLVSTKSASPVSYSFRWMINISSPDSALSLYEGNSTWIVVGDGTGRVMAVDMYGNLMWNRTMKFPVKDVQPDEKDGEVIVSNRTVCAALDASSGALKWTLTRDDRATDIFIPRSYWFQGSEVGAVFGTLDGKLAMVDMRDGTVKKEIALMEGRPVTGIGESSFEELYAGVNTEERGMGRIYCINDRNVEWYQNITGIPGNPVYIPLMDAVFVTTDAGMLYSLNCWGKITARMRVNGSYLFSPLFSEYVPARLNGAFFLFSSDGKGCSFSDKIVYNGESAEVLNAKPVSSVKIPWKAGQTWAYEWKMDFGNAGDYIVPGSGASAGDSKGLFIKMAYIRYMGKDENGYRFEYRGGSYAEGKLVLNEISNYYDYSLVDEIHEYRSSFSGNMWVRPESFNDSAGQHFYFGIVREKLNISLRYNITEHDIEHVRGYDYTSQSNANVSGRDIEIRYFPAAVFLPAGNDTFRDYQNVNMVWAGNISGYFGFGYHWGNYSSVNRQNITVKPGESVNGTLHAYMNITKSGDTQIISPLFRCNYLLSSLGQNEFYLYHMYSYWDAKCNGSFYTEIAIYPEYPIMPFFSYINPPPPIRINSTQTTPDNVDDFLSDEYAYVHREKGNDEVLTAVVMFSMAFLVLAALFVIGYRGKGKEK